MTATKTSVPPALPLTVAGGEYVIISRTEYLRLTGQEPGLSVAAAKAAVLAEMGRRVRAARKHAGLTQAELAARLGCTQAMVCRAEKGKASISDAFSARVHKACGLPPDWIPPVTA